MPPRVRNLTGYIGVRLRASGFFAAEITTGGDRVWLGTFDSPTAASAYDAQTWRFGHPRAVLNFSDILSRAYAEMLAPKSRLVTQQERRQHERMLSRLDIAKSNELAARRYAELHPEDVQREVDFYAARDAERKAQRKAEREEKKAELAERKSKKRFIEVEMANPNSTLDESSDLWVDAFLTSV